MEPQSDAGRARGFLLSCPTQDTQSGHHPQTSVVSGGRVDSPEDRDTVSFGLASFSDSPAFSMDLKLFPGPRENRPTNNDFVHQAAR